MTLVHVLQELRVIDSHFLIRNFERINKDLVRVLHVINFCISPFGFINLSTIIPLEEFDPTNSEKFITCDFFNCFSSFEKWIAC